jgi:hypothetical protein
MKILVSVAITLASFAAVQSANAADLNIERRSYYSGERTASTVWVWRAQPADILYKYAPEYPGWRGDAYYYNCRSVRVREIFPDGTIVVRHRSAC